MMKNPDRRKIYPDEGFIDQDESSLIIPMTLFKFKTFGANIYIIQNIIYNKYNSTFDEMWTMRLICLIAHTIIAILALKQNPVVS
jgi:hypothetical protein